VKLARDARQVSGREVFIAGSIGPLGEHEETWPEDRAPLFAEQARLLAGRGVDLFAVETFFDLEELVTAIEAVRSVSDLPIVAMMTFGDDAETIGGVSAAEAAERLAGLGIAAVGTNHGAGPDAALTALRRWATHAAGGHAEHRSPPACRGAASCAPTRRRSTSRSSRPRPIAQRQADRGGASSDGDRGDQQCDRRDRAPRAPLAVLERELAVEIARSARPASQSICARAAS
jgi:hypothetical protein